MARFALSVPCFRDAPEGRVIPNAGNTDSKSEAGIFWPVSFICTEATAPESVKFPVRSATAFPMCTSPRRNCPV